MIRKAVEHFYETELEDALIVMNVDSGKFHTLADTGLEIWSLIDGARTESEIVEILSDRYEVDPEVCAQDVARFVDQIVDAGLAQRD